MENQENTCAAISTCCLTCLTILDTCVLAAHTAVSAVTTRDDTALIIHTEDTINPSTTRTPVGSYNIGEPKS